MICWVTATKATFVLLEELDQFEEVEK